MQKPNLIDKEISNPVEVLTNLVYLTRHDAGDERKIILYMTMADEALQSLVEALEKLNSP